MWFKVNSGMRFLTQQETPEAVGEAFKAAMEYFVTREEQSLTEAGKPLYNALRNQIDQTFAVEILRTNGVPPRTMSFRDIALLFALMDTETATQVVKAVASHFTAGKTESLDGVAKIVFDILVG